MSLDLKFVGQNRMPDYKGQEFQKKRESRQVNILKKNTQKLPELGKEIEKVIQWAPEAWRV